VYADNNDDIVELSYHYYMSADTITHSVPEKENLWPRPV